MLVYVDFDEQKVFGENQIDELWEDFQNSDDFPDFDEWLDQVYPGLPEDSITNEMEEDFEQCMNESFDDYIDDNYTIFHIS